mgnify:CR=1 FL=1
MQSDSKDQEADEPPADHMETNQEPGEESKWGGTNIICDITLPVASKVCSVDKDKQSWTSHKSASINLIWIDLMTQNYQIPKGGKSQKAPGRPVARGNQNSCIPVCNFDYSCMV